MTKPTIHGNIIFAFGTRDAFAHGEMAEWSKAPVLKTGDVKASVGSNPTLSARKQNTRKYPSGRRGSPAKGVGRQKRREGSNPSHSATEEPPIGGFSVSGEMSERFKEPVLKTGDGATHRGFESHSLRHRAPPIWVVLFYVPRRRQIVTRTGPHT